jgi:hypothetical protein
MGVCFCRFTILTLRPAKILSRKNHTGGGGVPAQSGRGVHAASTHELTVARKFLRRSATDIEAG